MAMTSESPDCLNVEINIVGPSGHKRRKLTPEEIEMYRAFREGKKRRPSPDRPAPPPEQGGESK